MVPGMQPGTIFYSSFNQKRCLNIVDMRPMIFEKPLLYK